MTNSLKLLACVICTGLTPICWGDGGSNDNTTQASVIALNPEPTVSLIVSDGPYVANTPFTVTWDTINTDSCTFSGALSDAVSSKGSIVITPTEPGKTDITLTCGSASESLSVEVMPTYEVISCY